jgi:hypothetical protein
VFAAFALPHAKAPAIRLSGEIIARAKRNMRIKA